MLSVTIAHHRVHHCVIEVVFAVTNHIPNGGSFVIFSAIVFSDCV